MTRPIIWALMTLASAAISVPLAGERLAARFGFGSAGPAAETGAEPLVVTIWADGRGHFSASVAVRDERLRMLVDTGASFVALTESDARRAGIAHAHSPRRYTVSTANGRVEVPGVWIPEIRIGDIAVRNVEAVVMPDAQLGASLLGMSFLRRLRGFEVTGQRLTLRG